MDTNLNTLQCMDQYEKRFAAARLLMPLRQPWQEPDQSAIRRIVRESLRISDAYIPEIQPEKVRTVNSDDYVVDFLTFRSWDKVYGAASLYRPKTPVNSPSGKTPVIILCCGHAEYGRLAPGYQAVARRLARQGAAVLALDNIGQGERAFMGHADVVLPFACGLSVQGLIVLETMGWIRWLEQQTQFGPIAAIGNSGGGTLTLFLAALCPEIAVICSTGYPSSFEFIARKEKKHCHCNILPGIVGRAEMWELYSLFTPKPLYLSQGMLDHLFPEDLFYSMARKVRSAYRALGAEDNLHCESLNKTHSWNNEARFQIAEFLAKHLSLRPPEQLADDLTGLLDVSSRTCDAWPAEALTTDELACQLSGLQPASDLKLWDVFVPCTECLPLDESSPRGEIRQILAQYEAFLNGLSRQEFR